MFQVHRKTRGVISGVPPEDLDHDTTVPDEEWSLTEEEREKGKTEVGDKVMGGEFREYRIVPFDG